MKSISQSKFWMVWNPSGRSPSQKHESRVSADKEANRLARANPGSTFFVLKGVGGFFANIAEPVPVKLTPRRAHPDEIPY